MEVMSMSAEERILSMHQGRSIDGELEKTSKEVTRKSEEEGKPRDAASVDGSERRRSMGRDSVTKAAEKIDVQQRRVKIVITIPSGVNGGSEPGRDGERTNEWSLSKQKGWELIHRAELINYVRT
jgi:hypothetical protein